MKLPLLLIALLFQVANTIVFKNYPQTSSAKDLIRHLIDDGNQKTRGKISNFIDDSFTVLDCKKNTKDKEFFIKEYLLKGQTEIPQVQEANNFESQGNTYYKFTYNSSYYWLELDLVAKKGGPAELTSAKFWDCLDEWFRFE